MKIVMKNGQFFFGKKSNDFPNIFQFEISTLACFDSEVLHSKACIQLGFKLDSDLPIKHDGTKTLQQGLKNLLSSESPVEKNISLHCSDGQIVKCHKTILIARSEAFLPMVKDNNNVIKIKDFSSNAAKAFVAFLYTDEIPSREEDGAHRLIYDLFKMGDKYRVEYIKEKCERSLVLDTSVDMLPEVLVASFKFDAKELFNVTMKRVCDNLDLCQKMPEWDEVNKHNDLMNKILKFAVSGQKKKEYREYKSRR